VQAVSRRDDAGVIAIVVALFAVVLFGFAALVVDVGSAADVKAQAAAAADAGALAGVRTLASLVVTSPPPTTSALQDAIYDEVTGAVALNLHYQGQDWASCTDTTPNGFNTRS
jgi:Flp pilus assembly protein TadG